MLSHEDLVEELDLAWLGLTQADVKQHKFSNPFVIKEEDRDKFGITPLRVMRNPNYIAYAAKRLTNLDILPMQSVILNELFHRSFPMLIGSRGLGKSFILSMFAVLKMALTPRSKSGQAGVKIIITGSGFRQSKQVFEYVEQIYYNSPLLQSINTIRDRPAISREQDRYTFRLGSNTFIAIPLGNGEKVRGLRANIVIADEFNSIDTAIFDTVIQGFTAVSSNPTEKVRSRARAKRAKELGLQVPELVETNNQIIISGTAGYDFEPFAQVWKKHKKIIESCGEIRKLEEVYQDGIPESLNWKDYSILRIPHTLVPSGFLDEKIIARAKGTTHVGTFNNEYGAVFSKDSLGFFKRSVIDACVASDLHVLQSVWPTWCPTTFDAKLHGEKDKKYIIAIDPASEVDNFSIVVVELWPQHARVVYSWVTNKKAFKELVTAGFTKENDFYAYAARKIRELRKAFPCEHIVIDAQGGGLMVVEALHNKNNLLEGEEPIWPMVNPDKPDINDYHGGLHIVELVQFANYEWVYEANHGLKNDLESKTLLFPRFDQVSLEIAAGKDIARANEFERLHPGIKAKPYDTLEDCVFDIEELKDELTTIIVTRTGTGAHSRDRWDTPETKGMNGKKGRLRKDRYSALLMANMVARNKRVEVALVESSDFGGLLLEAAEDETMVYKNIPDNMRKEMELFYKGV